MTIMPVCLQVINEYKKAKALMEGIAAPNTKSVWHKLFTEVDKVAIILEFPWWHCCACQYTRMEEL